MIQCYEQDKDGVYRLTGYTLHSKLPCEKFVELMEMMKEDLWHIDRIKLIQCQIFPGENEIFERQVISYTKGETKIQAQNVVPGLIEFFLRKKVYQLSKQDATNHNSFVGTVVRKIGTTEEKLILEQSDLRVWFREGHTTIQLLKKEYEKKNETGEWTTI